MEGGWLPDALVRAGMRRAMSERLRLESAGDREGEQRDKQAWVDRLRRSPIAFATTEANHQHYELPPELFELMLGAHRKYSCCWFGPGVTDLDQAEADMLALTACRAELADGQRILELGCGWGSLTLWMAERYPRARITAVSNSAPQREFIEAECLRRGLTNAEIVTADVNDFQSDGGFDRVVSVEMFEHLRNWEAMLGRIGGWLNPGGKMFMHVFCHARHAYPFETIGEDDWMGRHFFTGGQMPSADLVHWFQRDLVLERQWSVSGEHYQKTAEAWLDHLDSRRDDAIGILALVHGAEVAPRALQRWRMFYMACAELFGWRGGDEWFVGHYLLTKR